jgi:ATP-dependent DNA helicase RecG
MNADEFQNCVNELIALPRETEWVEFKENNAKPEEIGEYLSAMANSAALAGKSRGYLVWGVRDADHALVGTTVAPNQERIGSQELENWLAVGLKPSVNFRIHEGTVSGHRIAMIEIPAATHTPVRWKDFEYIRVGSYKKKLRDHPEKERQLWNILSAGSFETDIALPGASTADVVALLDHISLFRRLGQPAPSSLDAVVDRFVDEDLLVRRPGGRYDVRNVGALLFARDLGQFSGLSRKAVRVVTYGGAGRTAALRERVEPGGYATSFQTLLEYIDSQVPRMERIEHGLRTDQRPYPEDTIREPLGNALIHQDFSMGGVSPLIEIFSNRIEITSPGAPLVPANRFLDAPPRSRNEMLAALMRRMRICEERGSGIDKVVHAAEEALLPPPDFQVVEDHVRVLIFSPRPFQDMTREERVRAAYQHASLQWVSNQRMTNGSLRQRFGIAEKNLAMVSRVISDAVDQHLVKVFDPSNRSRRNSQYVPFWA